MKGSAADDRTSFSLVNVLKSTALGAATGGAGHLTGNVTKHVPPGLARSVTKVVVDTACAAVIDTTTQLITEGEVDAKRVALNIGTRAATSAGFEALANATYEAHGGKEKLQDKLGDKEFVEKNEDPADKKTVENAKKFIERKLNPKDAKRDVGIARKATAAKIRVDEIKTDLAQIEKQQDIVKRQMDGLGRDKPNKPAVVAKMKQLQAQKALLAKQSNTLPREQKNGREDFFSQTPQTRRSEHSCS